MKRYTFQALVTLHDGGDGDPGATLGSAPRRMVRVQGLLLAYAQADHRTPPSSVATPVSAGISPG